MNTEEKTYGYDPEMTLDECLVADCDNSIDGDVVSDLASHVMTLQRELADHMEGVKR